MRVRFAFVIALLIGLVATSPACSRTPVSAQPQTPAKWSIAALGPDAAVPDKTFNAVISVAIDQGWKVYSLTQKTGTGLPVPLTITIAPGQSFESAGAPVGPQADTAFDPNFGINTEVYHGGAAFQVPIRAAAGVKPGETLRALVKFQTCNDRICMPMAELELKATDTTGGTAAKTGGGSVNASAGTARVPDLAASQASTLGSYVALAALMGALSLLTPCVFPMVPITVSYFTNRPGRTRRDAVSEALVYGLGIVLTFTAVGFVLAVGFGASGLTRFAANPWLNIGVTALFVTFALSLFGVWEIALPSSVVTAAARADAGRGRFIGTMLMGLAFTLTSFTCTAPFLGTLLVVAAQGDWQWPVAGMLAFSSVFAAPFVALALAPHWLKSLPRSGAWLIAVKAVMGMAELAAAMKFLSNVDLVWGWGIFTRQVVLLSWIAIAVLLALYLAGLIALGRAPKLKRPGMGRLAAIAATLSVAVWLGLGLGGRRLGELEAFLPPMNTSSAVARGELRWLTNYDDALAVARKSNQPVLINFTGYTCTNCRWMEANMFTRPEISRDMSRFVLVELYTDGRDEANRRYQQMEQDLFGTVALPYYAILEPNGTPKVAFGGLTRSSDEFLAFLRY